ncbi:hypothetical protein [Paenibacillus sp. y28]|uniref:hypothetical protein n=1 Tax=Paenibacillus sp. y28 TaxID=3129110 RepID=UPI003016DA4E
MTAVGRPHAAAAQEIHLGLIAWDDFFSAKHIRLIHFLKSHMLDFMPIRLEYRYKHILAHILSIVGMMQHEEARFVYILFAGFKQLFVGQAPSSFLCMLYKQHRIQKGSLFLLAGMRRSGRNRRSRSAAAVISKKSRPEQDDFVLRSNWNGILGAGGLFLAMPYRPSFIRK